MSETEANEDEVVEESKETVEDQPTSEPVTAPEEEKAPKKTAPAAEEEAAEGEDEIEVVEEKVYTIPLRHVWIVGPRGKRAPRAVRDVRAYVTRHMKAEEVAISNEVNAALWSRGINKPPRKITVRAAKDKEGKVIVYPAKAA